MAVRIRTEGSASLSIGQLSAATGVGVDAIRFYEEKGLLPEPRRKPSGYRVYSAPDVERLGFVRRAQGFGFSLDEISVLLQSRDAPAGVAATKALAEQKLAALEAKSRELLRLKADLEALVKRCPGDGETSQCPILGAFVASAPGHEGAT